MGANTAQDGQRELAEVAEGQWLRVGYRPVALVRPEYAVLPDAAFARIFLYVRALS